MKKWVMAGGAVLALSVASPAAFAVEERFDYLELKGTGTGDLDGVDIEEGVSLEAAKSANDVVFVRGTVDTYNFDETLPGPGGETGEDDTGVDFMSVGPGVGMPLGWAFVWGQVNYERLNYAGAVGTGAGAEIGATVGPADGMQLGVSARHGEPDFSESDDIEYQLYGVDGRLPITDASHVVVSYQEGTLETSDEDIDLNEVVSLGLRLGF